LFAILEEREVGETVTVTVLRDADTDDERTPKLRATLQALNE
jgi:hypothetical protein